MSMEHKLYESRINKDVLEKKRGENIENVFDKVLAGNKIVQAKIDSMKKLGENPYSGLDLALSDPNGKESEEKLLSVLDSKTGVWDLVTATQEQLLRDNIPEYKKGVEGGIGRIIATLKALRDPIHREHLDQRIHEIAMEYPETLLKKMARKRIGSILDENILGSKESE